MFGKYIRLHMKSIIMLITVTTVTCKVKSDDRLYDSGEENPQRVRYLPALDKDGKLYYEDLWKEELTSYSMTVPKITMYLYTPTNLDEPSVLPSNGSTPLNTTYFNASLPIYFLVHGWHNNYTTDFDVAVKRAIQKVADVNIFVVDWSNIARRGYVTATFHVPSMGNIVGDYIYNFVMTPYGLPSSQFILVGHSVGAHICGCIGAHVKALSGSLIGIIIALDPAGPLFSILTRSNRINRSQASFVQVIHTAGLLLGFHSALGHADYYPNGGISQPGCGFEIYAHCAHKRAYQYYVESLNTSTKNKFTSYHCGNFLKYSLGFCKNHPRSFMGTINIDTNARGDYYLSTNKRYPYARGYSVGRNYDYQEENPLRMRYLPVLDKSGKVYYEDLLRAEVTPDVNFPKVTMYLYSPLNPEIPSVLPANGSSWLYDTNFDINLPIYFLTHGWHNNYTTDFDVMVRRAILKAIDANVFVVDWSSIAKKGYVGSALKVQHIGQIVGDYIYDFIMTPYGVPTSHFTLIGHSLGAHITGCIGVQIKARSGFRIPIIIALDPAGPLFSILLNRNRIDRSHADFVQVIHTAGLLLGFRSSLGHADYYPNGGRTQPGCGFEIYGHCAHKRAYEYYAESLSESSMFQTYRCKTYWKFIFRLCKKTHRSWMGHINVDTKARGDYYLSTNSRAPYARG
ncbi:lipase [Holotrichia oblita]|uniref:Lipase n=1 Tax=Holotrichia oblita TaxID=644536 RepID=A0ACB9TPU6_HOLOL|nr:lipase [Holotrichia oblita]